MNILFYYNIMIVLVMTIGYFYMVKRIIESEYSENWWWGLPTIFIMGFICVFYNLEVFGVIEISTRF